MILTCQSCGTTFDEHDREAFVSSWTIKCGNCYYDMTGVDRGDVDHYRGGRGISPLGHTSESFAYAMWQQKRAQIDAWQAENGLDVPVALWDECNEWRRIWQAKFYKQAETKPDILADIMLQHQLKESPDGH